MTFWIKKLNINGITVVPLNHHGRSKEQRIRQFIFELYKETYYLLDAATRRDFVWQASVYKIGKNDNRDDLLDACAYGLDVRNQFWHLITTTANRFKQLTGEVRVVGNNTPF